MGCAATVLVEQATIPQLLEDPPSRFDVVVVQRHVGIVHVDPIPDAVGHNLPFFDVPENALPTAPVELGDAELLNVPLGGQAQFLFDLQFHGQAVGVPATLADYPATFHRAVAGNDVLENAGQHVVNAGTAIGGGRPLVHHEERGVGPVVNGPAEDIALLPVVEDLGVEFRETDPAGNHVKSRHGGYTSSLSANRVTHWLRTQRT